MVAVETTAAPVSTTAPTGDATTAPSTNNNNGPLVFGEDDETDAAVNVGNAGGSNMGLIIGIIAGALVVIGALVVVIIVMAKKNKGSKE